MSANEKYLEWELVDDFASRKKIGASRGIADLSSSVAKAATESVVKQYVTRKGMEQAAETAFKKAVEFGVSR